jgi:hypothetical protein
MAPAGVNAPVDGSYNSALAWSCDPFVPVRPPVIKTLPIASKAAVCRTRAAVMLPVCVKVRAAGSYNSALAMTWPGKPIE